MRSLVFLRLKFTLGCKPVNRATHLARFSEERAKYVARLTRNGSLVASKG